MQKAKLYWPCVMATLLWLCACEPAAHAQLSQTGSLRWSQFRGSFTQFVQQCIRQGATALVDKDVEVKETIEVNGDLKLDGEGHTLRHSLKQLFVLGRGQHYFSQLRIVQQSNESIAFATTTEHEAVWNNTLSHVHISGGRDGYASSRGGVYDKKTDSVLQWCGTTIEYSTIFVNGGCAISIFSQDGPTKYLHLRNVVMSTDTTHNIYIHPNVSLQMDSVVSQKAGKLAMHMYSGGNDWMYYTARYVRLHRVSSAGGAMWEMVNPRHQQCITITDSDIAPYTTAGVRSPDVCATNTRFYNNGNGAMLSGTLLNCRGAAWTAGPDAPPLVLQGGTYEEVSLRVGGKLKAQNAQIQFMEAGVRDVNFEASLDACTVEQLFDGGKGQGKMVQAKSRIKGQTSRVQQ